MVTTQHSASFSPGTQRTTSNLDEAVQEIEREHFAYEVVRTEAGNIRVRVDVEFENPQAFEAYRQYNRHLATQLAAHSRPTQVVTFSSPLRAEEAQQLVEGAGVKVLAYGAFELLRMGKSYTTYGPERTRYNSFRRLTGLPRLES